MKNQGRLWHNPRCGKSGETLALLREQGMESELFAYLQTSLTVERLKQVLRALGLEPPWAALQKRS